VLEHLRAEGDVEGSVRDRQVLRRADEIHLLRSFMRRLLPVSRPVLGVVEQLPVGGVARSDVEDAGALRRRAGGAGDEGQDRFALPRHLLGEGAETLG
jgi:hypothetical protein